MEQLENTPSRSELAFHFPSWVHDYSSSSFQQLAGCIFKKKNIQCINVVNVYWIAQTLPAPSSPVPELPLTGPTGKLEKMEQRNYSKQRSQ